MKTQDKDFQKMIHRIAFAALLFGMIFACMYAYKAIEDNEERNTFTYTASDTLRVRSQEAFLHTIIIRYQVKIDRGRMNDHVRAMFDANSNTFMRYIVFDHIENDLRNKVVKSLYFTPDSLDMTLRTLKKSFHQNLTVNKAGITVTMLEYHFYVDPHLLNKKTNP